MTLDELSALEAAATKGPWGWGELGHMLYGEEGTVMDRASGPCADGLSDADAALIAAARNALPSLIAVARAAQKVHCERFPISGNAIEASTQAYHELAVSLSKLAGGCAVKKPEEYEKRLRATLKLKLSADERQYVRDLFAEVIADSIKTGERAIRDARENAVDRDHQFGISDARMVLLKLAQAVQ